MVDFFVRVGAPDAYVYVAFKGSHVWPYYSEIDKLNHFGALITPPQIGFWIDVSQAVRPTHSLLPLVLTASTGWP